MELCYLHKILVLAISTVAIATSSTRLVRLVLLIELILNHVLAEFDSTNIVHIVVIRGIFESAVS